MAIGTCTQCGETFGGISTFDQHQKYDGEVTICSHPKQVGLKKGKRGYWTQDLEINS